MAEKPIEEELAELRAAQPQCPCGCPASDHTLRAVDQGQHLYYDHRRTTIIPVLKGS